MTGPPPVNGVLIETTQTTVNGVVTTTIDQRHARRLTRGTHEPHYYRSITTFWGGQSRLSDVVRTLRLQVVHVPCTSYCSLVSHNQTARGPVNGVVTIDAENGPVNGVVTVRNKLVKLVKLQLRYSYSL